MDDAFDPSHYPEMTWTKEKLHARDVKRAARSKDRVRPPRTENLERVSRAVRLQLIQDNPYPDDVIRPVTRADCAHAARPCPFVSCRFHLYLDVNDSGNIKQNFQTEPDEMARSCALDCADQGGMALEEIGVAMNLTRERIRQIETSALRKLHLSPTARRLR